MDERTVDLGGGRALGYREFGDPAGRPVLNCHGGLVCGLDVAPFHDTARALGVRIISPDRPGLGRSTMRADRTTADWSDDARSLLDVLGIAHAAVFGWSMGGQYALACAARLRDRVTQTVVIAGALPLDDDATFAELNKMDRRLTRLSQRRPHVARATFGALGRVVRHAPAMWTRSMTRDATAEEAKTVRALSDPGLAKAAAGALPHAAGMVEEYRAWARPWGFAPEDVCTPTTIWQGDADALISDAWGATLADRIPEARFELRKGEGHFVGYAHQEEVLRALAVAP